LQAHFEDKAHALQTVRFWMGEGRGVREDLHDEHRSGRPLFDHIDTQTLYILGKSPFESARSIAQTLNTSHNVVLLHQHAVLGFKSFRLRWVPHFLTADLRLKRKQIAREMIPYLEAASRDRWQHFVTGDEWWFFLDQSCHPKWCLARDDVSTIVRRDIQTQDFMLTRMWNSRGFHVVNQLLSDTKMNSNYFTTIVLAPVREEFIPRDRARHLKPLVAHMDSFSIHTSGTTQRFMPEHQMPRTPQPPYSPDLAPSDFYVFPIVKDRLERFHMVDDDELFEQLLEILQAVAIDELKRVFTSWIHRVREVRQGDGDYIA
jgi:histone-lysine N-methyltransferase SETMAR